MPQKRCAAFLFQSGQQEIEIELITSGATIEFTAFIKLGTSLQTKDELTEIMQIKFIKNSECFHQQSATWFQLRERSNGGLSTSKVTTLTHVNLDFSSKDAEHAHRSHDISLRCIHLSAISPSFYQS